MLSKVIGEIFGVCGKQPNQDSSYIFLLLIFGPTWTNPFVVIFSEIKGQAVTSQDSTVC